ncbi:MAG: hypothetical protein H5T72_01755 [Actinobacteria bacterium]|nr:hypothetical protein [Actinomycetota bacterium]
MTSRRFCPECGASRRIVREHRWLSDGTIVQAKNPDHRMIFIENENINGIFRNIEEIISMSIERIIVEAKRRATFDFVDHILPGVVKAVVQRVGVRPVIRNITALGKVMGYGNIELANLRRVRDEGDYVTIHTRGLYSIPLFCGDLAGSFNAIDRREVAVSYRELGPDELELTGFISVHPMELMDRLKPVPYTHKEGDIRLERCGKCGGPRALADYRWDWEKGMILHRESGRRMVILGPSTIDTIIDELQKELGESIPEVVIEAQRRFVREGFYSLDEARTFEDFRKALALRGLGNLRDMDWSADRLRFRLENPCLFLPMVGLVLGIFELRSGKDGSAEWEVRPDGDLVVEVSPKP